MLLVPAKMVHRLAMGSRAQREFKRLQSPIRTVAESLHLLGKAKTEARRVMGSNKARRTMASPTRMETALLHLLARIRSRPPTDNSRVHKAIRDRPNRTKMETALLRPSDRDPIEVLLVQLHMARLRSHHKAGTKVPQSHTKAHRGDKMVTPMFPQSEMVET